MIINHFIKQGVKQERIQIIYPVIIVVVMRVNSSHTFGDNGYPEYVQYRFYGQVFVFVEENSCHKCRYNFRYVHYGAQ